MAVLLKTSTRHYLLYTCTHICTHTHTQEFTLWANASSTHGKTVTANHFTILKRVRL